MREECDRRIISEETARKELEFETEKKQQDAVDEFREEIKRREIQFQRELQSQRITAETERIVHCSSSCFQIVWLHLVSYFMKKFVLASSHDTS